MAEKQSVESSSPPMYRVNVEEPSKNTNRIKVSKTLVIGVTIAVTVILLAAIIAGVAYFYRSTHTLKEVAKIYHRTDKNGVNEDIEIDTDKNIVIVHLNGEGIEPGTFVVLDYTKSLTGIHDAKTKRCYLIGGIQQEFLDPQHLRESLEKNLTQSTSGKTLRYKVSNSYPVSDKSFLPSALKKVCNNIPVFWLEPDMESSDTGVQKRQFCVNACATIFGVRVCYKNC
jgi:hypothetical protein